MTVNCSRTALRLLRLSALVAGLAGLAHASTPSEPAQPESSKTVALIAAIGDRISIVRQNRQVGSHLEPFRRKDLKVDPLPLNNLVLKAMDDGFAVSSPETKRVFLRWTPPPEDERLLSEEKNLAREQRMESLLLAHLASLPERQQWDEIVAVLPKWYFGGVKGMGTKLSGVGIYVQPLASEVPDDLKGMTDGTGGTPVMTAQSGDKDTTTVNPVTGEKGESSVFVAMFMYMQKITLDAKTLVVKSREVRRDNIKYYDPNSNATDVGKMFDNGVLLKGLTEVVEKAAKKSVTGNVVVGELKEVTPAPAQPASAPR